MITSRPAYTLSVLAISAMFFSTGGVQYWLTNYMIITLKIKESDANFAYAMVLLTAPIIGALLSGKVSMSLGGHSNIKTLLFGIVIMTIGVGVSIVFPLVDD